ncbi:hypothetical protein EYF80_014398 [Liparis tanakae]|uniref:Uncharacterized protein n=1 Tax=Liparis tanakae TaxID=230148 RepID=A0A4Z2ICB3_9TELE|nr:hypothetical protein EYF80_014398 [Liparis tanakae]
MVRKTRYRAAWSDGLYLWGKRRITHCLHCPPLLDPMEKDPSLVVVGKVCRGQGQQDIRRRVLDPLQPVTVRNLCDRRAVDGHRLQHALNGQLAWVGHVRRDAVGSLKDAALQLPKFVPMKGQSARHHEVQKNPQGPGVRIASDVTFVLEDFRSSVRRRATEVGEEVIRAVLFAEAEVSHLDAAAGGVEDVLRLKVSVDNVVVVLK